MTSNASGRPWRTARGGVALFALGMVGVLAAAAGAVPAVRALPGFEGASYPLLLAVAAANSVLLLGVAVALGAAAAPRIGLRSHVYAWAAGDDPDWRAFRESLGRAVVVGVGAFALVSLLDAAFAPFVSLPAPTSTDAESLGALAASLPLRLLYGGITEELLLRWGVMAPLAWLFWRLGRAFGSARASPSALAMWGAIAASAVAFGAGHLPALAAAYPLTAALVARTVLLNALVGVALGWLFWRDSLETAMVAHASFHVALVAVSALLVVAT